MSALDITAPTPAATVEETAPMSTTIYDDPTFAAMLADAVRTMPKVSTVLADAIAVIEARGWTRGEDVPAPLRDGERVTVLDALRIAAGLEPWQPLDHYHPAALALCEHLGLRSYGWSLPSLHGWNRACRSGWQVVTVLRAVAAIALEEGR